jgi:V/A-type H+-transporting ATPase subunit C
MSDTYTYAIARIRALEAKMISPAQVSRMVEAPDLDRAFFVLSETTYGDHISASINPFDYEEIIAAELARIYKFLSYYAGKDAALKTLWRKHDYGNAKILLRLFKKKQESVSVALSKFGLIDPERLSLFILKGEGSIPVWLEKPIGAALVAFHESSSPAEMDTVLDGAFLEDLIRSGNELLKKVGLLYKTEQFPVDLAGNNKTIEILRCVKRQAFGVGPLITFWLAKLLEVKTIRQILISKKHHLPTPLIKERIRSVYV